jgi:hypothetical protein
MGIVGWVGGAARRPKRDDARDATRAARPKRLYTESMLN